MRKSFYWLAFLCTPLLAQPTTAPSGARPRTTTKPPPAKAARKAAPTSPNVPFFRKPAQAPNLTPAPVATSPKAGTPYAPIPTQTNMVVPTSVSGGLAVGTYGELIQFETPPPNVVQWDYDNAKLITLSKDGPVLHLKGRLATGYEMLFDDEWVPLRDNRFDITLPLGGDPRLYEWRILDSDRRFRIYPMVFFFNRPLPGAPATPTRRFGFAQLYSGDKPTMIVDLDGTREASLSFRVYLPPGTDPACERWDLIIENMAGREVAHLFRKGFPPPFVDWRVLRERIQTPGEYHYRLQMTYGGKKFEGAPSRFHAFAGGHVYEHPYTSIYKLEPRQEIGMFTYSNPLGLTYQAPYIGADLALAVKQRWLMKISGMTELPGSDPTGVMTFFRFGAGVRVAGVKPNTSLGNPFLFQADVLVGYSNFLLGKPPLTSHFGSPSGLIEARFVFYSKHRLAPWAEIGSKLSPSDFFRFSAGINYSYYLRTWNLSIGAGVAYDQLVQFPDAPNLRFTLMRAVSNLTFYL